MSETDHEEIADAALDIATEFDAQIAALRTSGVGRFDPVGLHYIEVLVRRAGAHQGGIRRILHAKGSQALAALTERFEQARCNAIEAVALGVRHHPHASAALLELFAEGDFKGLHRLIARLEIDGQGASLGALVRQLEQHTSGNADAGWAADAVPHSELKTVRSFRNTWAKLSIDKQMALALEQAPKNAGPINSHVLVLRSLVLMRDISPEYLNRFMLYTDTLLCLDQSEKEKSGVQKKRPAAKLAKK
jgi:hypothetical protein